MYIIGNNFQMFIVELHKTSAFYINFGGGVEYKRVIFKCFLNNLFYILRDQRDVNFNVLIKNLLFRHEHGIFVLNLLLEDIILFFVN